ncbi:hypothetical protein [Nocardia nepalensis]|uniref:hypothetical protein n=1 Tax=Nocardia nepalensis TaxID=3375448 RepID=UPI003B672516
MLVQNCAITLAKDYRLPIGGGSECPFPTKGDAIGVYWWYAYSLDASGKNVTLAKLENSPATYESCKKSTKYVKGLTYPTLGDVLCYVGNGVVAALAFTANSEGGTSPGFAEFNLTIWQG